MTHVGPLLIILASGLTFAFLWTFIRRTLRDMQMTRRFTSYVDPEVVSGVLKQNEGALPPVNREMTLGHVNIHGWVTLCEQMGGERAVQLLNRYMTAIIPAVRKERGMVLEVMADQVFLAVNALAITEDHAVRGVRIAQDIRTQLTALRAEFPALDVTIALVTGRCVAGDISSAGRSTCSVLGETVNLVARLAKLPPSSPGIRVLLGGATIQAVAAPLFSLTSLPPIKVAGKTDLVPLCQLEESRV